MASHSEGNWNLLMKITSRIQAYNIEKQQQNISVLLNQSSGPKDLAGTLEDGLEFGLKAIRTLYQIGTCSVKGRDRYLQ